MKKIYPDVPELDWLDTLVDELTYIKRWSKFATKLGYVYKYLLWDRRFKASVPQSDQWLIAFGFVRKYYHLVFNVPMNEQDKKTVAISEEQYKKLRRGEKLT